MKNNQIEIDSNLLQIHGFSKWLILIKQNLNGSICNIQSGGRCSADGNGATFGYICFVMLFSIEFIWFWYSNLVKWFLLLLLWLRKLVLFFFKGRRRICYENQPYLKIIRKKNQNFIWIERQFIQIFTCINIFKEALLFLLIRPYICKGVYEP